jgi:hypothetical protein
MRRINDVPSSPDAPWSGCREPYTCPAVARTQERGLLGRVRALTATSEFGASQYIATMEPNSSVLVATVEVSSQVVDGEGRVERDRNGSAGGVGDRARLASGVRLRAWEALASTVRARQHVAGSGR